MSTPLPPLTISGEDRLVLHNLLNLLHRAATPDVPCPCGCGKTHRPELCMRTSDGEEISLSSATNFWLRALGPDDA